MKTSHLVAVLSLTFLFGIGTTARAQDADRAVVSVPFEFVAGGVTLPAGKYRVSAIDVSVGRELAIRGSGKDSAFLLPTAFDGASANQSSLRFERVGDKYFLSKIKTLDGVYTMARPPKIVVGQMNPAGAMPSSGTH